MDLPKLSQADLEEWRAHPVSGLLRQAFNRLLAAEREWLTQRYWAGQPVSEAHRLAFLRKRELAEDLFEATAEEFEAMLKDEYETQGATV